MDRTFLNVTSPACPSLGAKLALLLAYNIKKTAPQNQKVLLFNNCLMTSGIDKIGEIDEINANNGNNKGNICTVGKSDIDLISVLEKKATLNQAVNKLSFAGITFDTILGNPQQKEINQIPTGYFSWLAEDLKLLALNYQKVILNTDNINSTDKNRQRAFFQTEQTLIILTSPESTAVCQSLNIIKTAADNPYLKVCLCVCKAETESDGVRTFNAVHDLALEKILPNLYYGGLFSDSFPTGLDFQAQKILKKIMPKSN